MRQPLYREPDFAFGEAMLTLRSAIGLTQSGLAGYLGISRRAVGDWEAGNKYPKFENLKQFITLAVRHRVFKPGQEAEEIHLLWKSSHQKVPLDGAWLNSLLKGATEAQYATNFPASVTGVIPFPAAKGGTVTDWGEAPSVSNFYGREFELSQLKKWVVEDNCRVVSLLGLGGIGKSTLSTNFMREVTPHFEVVIWRSLRDAPKCEELVEECLHVLSYQSSGRVFTNLEQRLEALLRYLQNHRILLVLDNYETVLEEDSKSGYNQAECHAYGRLLRRLSQTDHQSCLLLTSREKPGELIPLEGPRSPVRALRLSQLDPGACEQLLADKDLGGTLAQRRALIKIFAGNPLALKIVAQTIRDLFDGEIAPFLQQGEFIYGGVRDLLDQQFNRLSSIEQTVLKWLTMMREPATLDELHAVLGSLISPNQLLEAIEALHRRSLIEPGERPASFTLQSVVLEYMKTRVAAEVSYELRQANVA